MAPAEVVLTENAKGKPMLCAPSNLHFKLSHSGGLTFFAFTLGCEIGIDVEERRPIDNIEDIARRFFSRVE